jgi:uncharacterized protein YjbI with pentapeptide repeats
MEEDLDVKIDLVGVDFRKADLLGIDLTKPNLRKAHLKGADLAASLIGGTTFGNNDLSASLGLETIRHGHPSIIGVDTISGSNGIIRSQFVRGCGLSDWEIEAVKLHDPELNNDEVT